MHSALELTSASVLAAVAERRRPSRNGPSGHNPHPCVKNGARVPWLMAKVGRIDECLINFAEPLSAGECGIWDRRE